MELSRGAILIDGRDISTVPLTELRQQIAIIPQDPVIFSGTIRFQLDPFNAHSDEEVWEALRSVNLEDYIASLPLQLQEKISSTGESLSLGQRQLICIARALIKRTKILIMDEATSAVDPHTDAVIRSSIAHEVMTRQLTVLTIAHRIETILDYDRVLVMGEGCVLEFGAPSDLLANSGSAFSQMMARHHGA